MKLYMFAKYKCVNFNLFDYDYSVALCTKDISHKVLCIFFKLYKKNFQTKLIEF